MVRVALAIQSLGPDTTTLPGPDDFAGFSPPRTTGTATPGCPGGRLRGRSGSSLPHPVSHTRLKARLKTPADLLREYALYRGEATAQTGSAGLSFLHDSFLYYYEALAHPGVPRSR